MMAAALGGRKLMTETFTSSQAWVAPSGVSMLLSASGNGSNGTNDYVATMSAPVVNVFYEQGSGATATPVDNWEDVQGYAESAAADLNSDGSASWTHFVVHAYQYFNDSMDTYEQSVSGAIPGTAYAVFEGNWNASGPIYGSGSSSVEYQRNVSGSAGESATAFGRTFQGGIANGSAPTTSFVNLAVTPGVSYPLSIPSGGSVTISYYK